MKKILVTGAGGFVGSRVMQQWAGHYELCTFPKGFLATAGEDAVRQAVLQQRPDVILHTAAISDTGYCAGHPEQAYRANVELSVWLKGLYRRLCDHISGKDRLCGAAR